MSVKVITDSTTDIPTELIEELGIGIVPIYIHFGEKTYRDRVDISTNEFYAMLKSSSVHPSTSQPNPEDFVTTYKELCSSHDGIVSVHISSKISGTCSSALTARETLKDTCPIEVIDSKFNSSGTGLVTLAAARLAKAGAGFHEIIEEARKAIIETRMFGMFEHMKYLARSGRINKTIASASQFLNVMPLMTFNDGELSRAGFVRKVEKGMEKIYEYAKKNLPAEELFIVHSQVEDRALLLKKRLSEFIREEKIHITELGASLGVHGGPGVLLVALRRSV